MKSPLKSLFLLTLFLAFSVTLHSVNGHTGIYSNTPPWLREGEKQMNQYNSTEGFASQYSDPRSPGLEQRASFAQSQGLVPDYVVVALIAALVVFAVYAIRTERRLENPSNAS